MIQIIKRDKQVSNELLNRLAKKHKTTKTYIYIYKMTASIQHHLIA